LEPSTRNLLLSTVVILDVLSEIVRGDSKDGIVLGRLEKFDESSSNDQQLSVPELTKELTKPT
jgi:hypothetical protein